MRGNRQHGFSLLEVVVAFSILALSLGVLMQIFSGSLRNAELSRDQAQAVSLAQSLLASAGVEAPLAAGQYTGNSGGKFHWMVQVTPAQQAGALPGLPGGTTTLATLDLWEIVVQVAWGDDSSKSGRTVNLATLRVQPPPRP